MSDESVLTPRPEPEDLQIERSLRPRSLHEFIGQSQTKEHLSIILDAARARGEAADHLLFAGSPGLGKTTLAHIVSSELGVGLKVTSGPALERLGDLAAILTNLEERDVLFIDEIHRLSRPVEEMMYPAMEDGKIDLVIGKGPSARSIRLDLPPFTLVGATTRTGLLTSPLRDRFGFLGKLDFYEAEELVEIVLRSARLMELDVELDAAREIAGRSRGTPRISNRLLRRVRDYSQIKADGTITLPITKAALSLFGVDDAGLDKVDKSILVALVERFRGQPVGLNTLAVAIGEEPETLEDVYEPFLLRRGFIQRTPRGRKATVIAFEHLGLLEPATDRLL